MDDDIDLVTLEFQPECAAVLLCLSSNYDGFTPGRTYRVCGTWVAYEGAHPMVRDNWNEHTAAGGTLGEFEAA